MVVGAAASCVAEPRRRASGRRRGRRRRSLQSAIQIPRFAGARANDGANSTRLVAGLRQYTCLQQEEFEPADCRLTFRFVPLNWAPII